MNKVIFSIVLFLISVTWALSQSVAIRAVKVKGSLKCGREAAKQVKVVLYRVAAEGNKLNPIEELDSRDLSPEGLFEVGANTNGRPTNETELKPALRVFHRCDVKDKAKDRSFQVRIPEAFVTLGKTARQTYDIGTLNLELAYPGESSLEYPKKN